jgi:hypothetical protein
MGDTVRFAERMRLVEMEPRGDLTSTGYALANEGEEYLVLQPNEAAEPFTVTPEAGTYRVEWFGVDSRETANAGYVRSEGSTSISFSAPFDAAGPVVLDLQKAEG